MAEWKNEKTKLVASWIINPGGSLTFDFPRFVSPAPYAWNYEIRVDS